MFGHRLESRQRPLCMAKIPQIVDQKYIGNLLPITEGWERTVGADCSGKNIFSWCPEVHLVPRFVEQTASVNTSRRRHRGV